MIWGWFEFIQFSIVILCGIWKTFGMIFLVFDLLCVSDSCFVQYISFCFHFVYWILHFFYVDTSIFYFECIHFGSKAIYIVIFPVCILGAPRIMNESFAFCFCLVDCWKFCTTLPWGLNIVFILIWCFALMMMMFQLCYAKVLCLWIFWKSTALRFW